MPAAECFCLSPMSSEQAKLPVDDRRPASASDASFNEPAPVCSNCGALLQGPFCHVCGQAAKTPLRHLPGLVEDALDTLLDFDGRFVHTLPALYTRPGFLSREYFAGRRTRYIAPFRLMFLLCLLAFFVTRLELNHDTSRLLLVNPAASAEASAEINQQLAHWRKAAKVDATPASAASISAPATASSVFDDTPIPGHFPSARRLDPRRHPISVSGLPVIINQAINAVAARMYDNAMALVGDDPVARAAAKDRVISQSFAVLPQTLLVLLPLFALLLKLVYLFKRRLYVEHLVVALHSHAFLFLSLLLLSLLALVGHLTGQHSGLRATLDWAATAAAWWVPIHLLLAQKRIYGQGWTMTLLKYAVVGISYLILVSGGLIVAAVIGLSAV